MRLDIGHSLDILNIYSDEDTEIRAGGDFFILSRLRAEGRMKFPVETADYYFGLNCSGKLNYANQDLSFRLRVAHISSHLIDGYTNKIDTQLIFIQPPFVYSREFVDLSVAWQNDYLRAYFGGTVIFSTIPRDVNRFVPQIGFNFEYPVIKNCSIIGGYDFKYVGEKNNASIGSNSIQFGAMYELSKQVGISLNCYYCSGTSVHGMFL